MEVIAKDEKSRKAFLTAQHVLKKSPEMLKATSVAMNLSKVAKDATRVKKASKLLSRIQKASPKLNLVANVGKASTQSKSFIGKIFKWGKGSTFGASFAAGMSVYDIISTWTTTPASLEEMDIYIKQIWKITRST